LNEERIQLVLYSRYGCHLCEDMLQLLHDFAEDLPFDVRVIDIDDHADLKKQYNEAVPLLMHNSTEICRHFLDSVALQRAVETARANAQQRCAP